MIFEKSVLFTKKELRKFCTYRLIFGIFYSVMSIYGVSKTLIQMPFGVVSDKLGDKATLVISILFMSIVPFCYTLFKIGQVASYIYIIQGGVLGMAAPATLSILSRSVDEKSTISTSHLNYLLLRDNLSLSYSVLE